jgi:hypothetical protein
MLRRSCASSRSRYQARLSSMHADSAEAGFDPAPTGLERLARDGKDGR